MLVSRSLNSAVIVWSPVNSMKHPAAPHPGNDVVAGAAEPAAGWNSSCAVAPTGRVASQVAP